MSPYFDVLFRLLAEGDPSTSEAFGKHVHWGYWAEPETATGEPADYGRAAEQLTEQMVGEAKIADGQAILDVGCGFGGTLSFLNDRFRSVSLTGVNIDSRQLDRAQEQVKPRRGNEIKWACGDACDLPLSEEMRYDVVLAVECIFHFPSRGEFFSQVARRMTPDARLVISDFVPTPSLARYLASQSSPSSPSLPDWEALASSYGDVDLRTTLEDYRSLGAAHGLTLQGSRDVTDHTLPTYDFLLSHLEHWDDKQLAEDFRQATRWLAGASRKRMLTYQFLTFAVAVR